jgi:archaellin
MTQRQQNVVTFIYNELGIQYHYNRTQTISCFIKRYWKKAQKKHTIDKVNALLQNAKGSIEVDLYKDIIYMVTHDVIFFKYDKDVEAYIKQQLDIDLARFINNM